MYINVCVCVCVYVERYKLVEIRFTLFDQWDPDEQS